MVRPVHFVGMSAAAWNIARDIEFAARCNAPVLLTGERGVGKTLIGRTIHERSPRSRMPLVMIDCGTRHEPSLESALSREAPDGGTILLKEPGKLSPGAQAALLGFFETREGQALSSGLPARRSDARVISMTRQPLFKAVMTQRFLPDLYYRLNVVHIEIPPLRDRREDVPALIHGFLNAGGGGRTLAESVSGDALQLLMAYSWPGNVRELETLARSLSQTCGSGRVEVGVLPRAIVNGANAPARPAHEDLFARLVEGHASFWQCVYEPFMARDLTRITVRELVRLGVERTGGDYRALATALRVASHDGRRFLAFLRKYHCLYPFTPFQPARATLRSRQRHRSRGA